MQSSTQDKLNKAKKLIGKRFKVTNSPYGFGKLKEVKHQGFLKGLVQMEDEDGRASAVSVWKSMDSLEQV